MKWESNMERRLHRDACMVPSMVSGLLSHPCRTLILGHLLLPNIHDVHRKYIWRDLPLSEMCGYHIYLHTKNQMLQNLYISRIMNKIICNIILMLGNEMLDVSTFIKGKIICLDVDLNVFVVLAKITWINTILANRRTQFVKKGFLFSKMSLDIDSYNFSHGDIFYS